MLTVNWNCHHYYQKNRRGQGAPVFVEGGRLCHGTMAQWPVQACCGL